ncbi:MAG: hypothetical protein FJ207_02530 [Gemmatimonadetes bacterium]|nr:hypothetical protein [Gemmatimonadota bacterium]
MPTEPLAEAAEKVLEAALTESGARDPREFYRDRLRELKRLSPDEYQRAVTYYAQTLLPEVAERRRDPLVAWTDYGRRLAEALAPGRTVAIDASGRARPYEPTASAGLILHLPDDKGAKALLVALPKSLTAEQRATYDVLVAGKQRTSADVELPE